VAFLDFVKNRNASQQQPVAEKSQAQKPETAKEMYTREAAQEKANRVAPTADQEARAQKIGDELRKATQHLEHRDFGPSNAPAGSGSNAPQLQKQNKQDKAQEALSPTDDAAGKTAVQDKQPKQEKASDRRPQTVPRRAPSWER
jgi:hypothetical protein